MKMRQLTTELVDIDKVKPYHANARVGDVAVIRESLRKNGQYRPIVVWAKTKEILAGNHTWKAAKEENWSQIYVTWIRCDAETARRINLVDNRAGELGTYDPVALEALLGSMPSLEGTGWSQEAMEAQLGSTPPLNNDLSPEDDEPVPEDDYRSQYGVIVLCEDQRHQETVYNQLKTSAEAGDMGNIELKVVAV